jgi:hypothetical protein
VGQSLERANLRRSPLPPRPRRFRETGRVTSHRRVLPKNVWPRRDTPEKDRSSKPTHRRIKRPTPFPFPQSPPTALGGFPHAANGLAAVIGVGEPLRGSRCPRLGETRLRGRPRRPRGPSPTPRANHSPRRPTLARSRSHPLQFRGVFVGRAGAARAHWFLQFVGRQAAPKGPRPLAVGASPRGGSQTPHKP